MHILKHLPSGLLFTSDKVQAWVSKESLLSGTHSKSFNVADFKYEVKKQPLLVLPGGK